MPRRRQKPTSQPKTGQTMPPYVRSYSPVIDESKEERAGQTPIIEPNKKRSVWKRLLIFVILVIVAALVFVGVIAAWDVRNISHASQKLFGTGNVMKLINSSPLKTTDQGRVNILLAGYSADDPGHQGADLTDSIMILSLNPANKTGYMLSVPRDLYVQIPGYGYHRINEAYKDGGMDLLAQIIEQDFQIPISYWAIINYGTVRDVVNAVGGIEVTVNSPDGRLYDPNKDWTTGGPLVDLSNGKHHLDGQQALDFTRARGDPSQYGYAIGFEQSDFQRTADQRQVVAAIKAKLNWKLILNPRKNSQILNAIADNIKTNIRASEARPLFNLFNSVPNSQLQSLSLNKLNGKNYLAGYNAYGQDVQIPAAGIGDYSAIDQALADYNR